MTEPADKVIYKIVTSAEWEEARSAGVFKGAPVDLEDGFIHFSTREQVVETAARHFAGKTDLLLISVSSTAVAADLKFEPSRGGQAFPASLRRPAVLRRGRGGRLASGYGWPSSLSPVDNIGRKR